jgi:MFS family permease
MGSSTNAFLKNYLAHYTDVPKGTGKVIPLVVIESIAMCVSHLISIYLVHSLHFTTFQVGKLMSAFSLGTCIGSLISGYLTTRISVVKVSAFGIFLYAVGFFLLSSITSYSYLLAILFLCGIGGVFMMIANLTALIKLADSDAMKNRIIVIQSVVFNLSFSISSFFMSYFQAERLKNLFLLFGFLLLFSAIFLLSRDDGFVMEKRKASYSVKKNLSALGMIIPVVFVYGIIYSLIRIYFPLEAVSRFNSPFYSWLILSLNPMMLIFVQPLLIGKLQAKGNLVLLGTGAFFFGTGYFLFGITSYLVWSLIFIFFASIGEMLFSPISKKIAATSFGPGNEGLGLATWKMTYYLSGVIGAIFVGFVGENYSNINIWAICIPLSLFIILFVICYGRYADKFQMG